MADCKSVALNGAFGGSIPSTCTMNDSQHTKLSQVYIEKSLGWIYSEN
jgi:hypothetical protein